MTIAEFKRLLVHIKPTGRIEIISVAVQNKAQGDKDRVKVMLRAIDDKGNIVKIPLQGYLVKTL